MRKAAGFPGGLWALPRRNLELSERIASCAHWPPNLVVKAPLREGARSHLGGAHRRDGAVQPRGLALIRPAAHAYLPPVVAAHGSADMVPSRRNRVNRFLGPRATMARHADANRLQELRESHLPRR